MNPWRKRTKLGLIGAFAVGCVYDLIAYNAGGNGATISRVLLSWATDYPIVAIAFGVLLGHLFVPQHVAKKDEPK